jgi:hypothetical protein
MARLEFDGAAKGGVEKVSVDIDDRQSPAGPAAMSRPSTIISKS